LISTGSLSWVLPWRASALAALALLVACASPEVRVEETARKAGFEKEIVAGAGFRHVVYRHTGLRRTATLHVYIEGDGTPYVLPDQPTDDPTPYSPMMLELMALDASPSVYIGRPCYFGLASDPGCRVEEWTLRRFAPEVIDSMASVLRAEMARSGAARAELFGHSGGGTLAVLLADRVEQVDEVATLAPTLDTDAWCALHQYSPLQGSLNPARENHPQRQVTIVHWVGERDTNVPATMVSAAAHSRGETVEIVPKFDHTCCWARKWPEILASARARGPRDGEF
jgi:dienelactone hydrolase